MLKEDKIRKLTDQLVEEWHLSSGVAEISLAEYMKLSQQEYRTWVTDPSNIPEDFLDRHSSL